MQNFLKICIKNKIVVWWVFLFVWCEVHDYCVVGCLGGDWVEVGLDGWMGVYCVGVTQCCGNYISQLHLLIQGSVTW